MSAAHLVQSASHLLAAFLSRRAPSSAAVGVQRRGAAGLLRAEPAPPARYDPGRAAVALAA